MPDQTRVLSDVAAIADTPAPGTAPPRKTGARAARQAARSLWFATDKGLLSYHTGTGKWSTYSGADGMPADSANAVASDGRGSLWVSTKKGLGVYALSAGEWKQPADSERPARALHLDSQGRMWAATAQELVAYNTETRARERRLAAKNVRALVPQDDTLWFADGRGQLARHDTGELSTKFSVVERIKRGRESINAIDISRDGQVWLGTDKGLSHYHIWRKRWQHLTTEDGLPDMQIHDLELDKRAALWLATQGGVARYQINDLAWVSLSKSDGLPDDRALSVHADSQGAVWFGLAGGTIARLIGDTEDRAFEAGSLVTVPARARGIAAPGGRLVSLVDGGVCFARTDEHISQCVGMVDATVLAPAAGGRVWVGTALGGLRLVQADGKVVRITERLPSLSITSLGPVTGSGGRRVWVGTSGGAALVTMNDEGVLRAAVDVAQILPALPPGPVDAIAGAADGSAYVAYNAIDSKRFYGDKKLAEQRSRTEIWYIGKETAPHPLAVSNTIRPMFERATVHGLAHSGEHGLWIATSSGLFRVSKGDSPIGKASNSVPPVSIRHVAVEPSGSGTIWLGVDGQNSSQPYLMGHDPDEDAIVTVTQEHGLPAGASIEALVIAETGQLFVEVDDLIATGRISVKEQMPWWWFAAGGGALVMIVLGLYIRSVRHHPDVVRLQADPHGLTTMVTLNEVGAAIRRLRRAYVVDEVLEKLGLPPSRTRLIETMAHNRPCGADDLRALAMLLGMDPDRLPEVNELGPGIYMLPAAIDKPAPLQDKLVPIFAYDGSAERDWAGDNARRVMEEAMTEIGYPEDSPYLLLCRETPIRNERNLLPRTHPKLVIGEDEQETLLLTPKPNDALTGYLVTRGLFEDLSPYTTAGEVKSKDMFFGRSTILEKIGSMQKRGHLIVGPRRIGKSSLLKLLEQRMLARGDIEVVFLDFYGIKRHEKVARKLARKLRIDVPTSASRTQFTDILRRRYEDGAKKGQQGLILVDEFDWLAKSDAKLDYPLLSAMRTLQAEGLCSFILTGFDYLHLEVLNQDSPLYNFAHLSVLGPLAARDAFDLATKPMERLGIRYQDERVAWELVDLTGGYPSQVQQFCATLLEQFDGKRLAITRDDLEATRRSYKVRDFLVDSFFYNTSVIERIAMLGLLHVNEFSEDDFEDTLEQAVGRSVPYRILQEALRHLRIAGFVLKEDRGYRWSIPLLRESLTTKDDPKRRIKRLISELPDDIWSES